MTSTSDEICNLIQNAINNVNKSIGDLEQARKLIQELRETTFGEKHIFTREEISKMTGKEFAQNEKEIMAQLKQGLIN